MSTKTQLLQSGDIYVSCTTHKKKFFEIFKRYDRILPVACRLFCLSLFLVSFNNSSQSKTFFPTASAEAPHTFAGYIALAETPIESTPTPTPIFNDSYLLQPTVFPQKETNEVKPIQDKSSLSFIQPVSAFSYISTYFSYWHPGIDLVDPSGTIVMASTDGVVIHAGWSNDGYGNMIEIQHANGYYTLYAHLSEMDANIGQSVSKGYVIGKVGCTGNCTGSHLHFEIHSPQSALDPLAYI